MTATQAVLAVAIPALATVAILLGRIGRRPGRRGRHAIATWQQLTEATRDAQDALLCGLEDLMGRPAEPLATPQAVAPLRAALERSEPVPANPLDAMLRHADEELAANERFRAWLAGGERQ